MCIRDRICCCINVLLKLRGTPGEQLVMMAWLTIWFEACVEFQSIWNCNHDEMRSISKNIVFVRRRWWGGEGGEVVHLTRSLLSFIFSFLEMRGRAIEFWDYSAGFGVVDCFLNDFPLFDRERQGLQLPDFFGQLDLNYSWCFLIHCEEMPKLIRIITVVLVCLDVLEGALEHKLCLQDRR